VYHQCRCTPRPVYHQCRCTPTPVYHQVTYYWRPLSWKSKIAIFSQPIGQLWKSFFMVTGILASGPFLIFKKFRLNLYLKTTPSKDNCHEQPVSWIQKNCYFSTLRYSEILHNYAQRWSTKFPTCLLPKRNLRLHRWRWILDIKQQTFMVIRVSLQTSVRAKMS